MGTEAAIPAETRLLREDPPGRKQRRANAERERERPALSPPFVHQQSARYVGSPFRDVSHWPTPTIVLELGWLAAAAVVPLFFLRNTNEHFELPKQAAFRVILLTSLAFAAAFALAWPGARGPGGSSKAGPTAVSLATVSRRIATIAGGLRRIVAWPASLPALAVVFTWTLSTALSVAPSVSWWGSYVRSAGLRTQLAYVALFLIAAGALRTRQQLWRLALVTAGTATLTAAYAIIQRLGWDPFPWATGVPQRPFSTFGNPNFLAAYLSLTVFVTIGAGLSETRWAQRSAWTIALLTQTAALVLTQTRGAWVGVAAGLSVFVVLLVAQRGGPWRRLAFGATAVALLMAGGLWIGRFSLPRDGVLGRAVSIFDPSDRTASIRLGLWPLVLGLAAERPVVGFGPDTLGSIMVRAYSPRLGELENDPEGVWDRAHNATIDTLVTVGAFGGLALLTVGWATAIAGWRLLRPTTTPGSNHEANGDARTASSTASGHPLIPALLAGLLAHVVEQQFSLGVVGASFLAWLMAGALMGCAWPHAAEAESARAVERRAGGRRSTRQRAVRTLGPNTLAALGMAASVAVGFGWLELQPLRADVAYAQALRLARARHPDEAAWQMAHAAALWPHQPKYWTALASLQVDKGLAAPEVAESSNRLALQAAAEALRRDPAHPLHWSNWGGVAGRVANRSADTELAARARSAHDRATREAPDYWVFWRAAGLTELRLGDYAAAKRALLRATFLYPSDELTWSLLADAARAVGDFETAREASARTLLLKPADARARQALEELRDR